MELFNHLSIEFCQRLLDHANVARMQNTGHISSGLNF